MSFVLRLYLLGLLVFVPQEDRSEMTVLLVDVPDTYLLSNGQPMQPHRPILLARAGHCEGHCLDQAGDVASYLYGQGRGPSAREDHRQLMAAIDCGGVWELDREELSIRSAAVAAESVGAPGLEIVKGRRRVERDGPESLPRSRWEMEDFMWVAEIDQIVSDTGGIHTEALSSHPTRWIAGRLQLSGGMIKTYRMVGGNRVQQVFFSPIGRKDEVVDYRQAVAEWIVVDIPIEGCEVQLEARRFGSEETRLMTLEPAICQADERLEVVIMNLPEDTFEQLQASDLDPGEPSAEGHHFEIYFELVQDPPPVSQRPVPHLATIDVQSTAPIGDSVPQEILMPRGEDSSTLLPLIGLPFTRSVYSLPLCPPAQLSPIVAR